MTTYYVGKGGNDGSAGTSWAARKLTLNGAEDIPVVPGDTVIVGPGTYRELLTIDVTGTAGNTITYEGDRSGYRTDGIGGKVIITGSDDDIVETRNHCIDAGGGNYHYRTWRNLVMGWTDQGTVQVDGGVGDKDAWVFEDCVFCGVSQTQAVYSNGFGDDWAFRRCVFITNTQAIRSSTTAHNGATGSVVESCVFLGNNTNSYALQLYQSSWTVRNCTFIGNGYAVYAAANNGGTPYMWVYNSIIGKSQYAFRAAALGDLVEDYNGLYSNSNDRTNVAAGGNSVTYYPLWEVPLLQAGIQAPVRFPFLSQWSAYRRLTDSGTVPSGGDLFGIPFPATNGKRSWGAIQYQPFERDGTVYRGASGASALMADAGPKTFLVPVSASSTTFEVYVQRGANYAGSNPRAVIRQSGQSEIEVVDAGAAGAFNQLTHTWTPAATPPWVQIILESRNSAGAGDYTVNWDDLKVEVGA
jgi:hypothetical protein